MTISSPPPQIPAAVHLGDPPAAPPPAPLAPSLGRVQGGPGAYVRHGLICLILAAQLLPVYMMFQISFKSNPEFLASPFAPPTRWHGENWSSASRLLMPYMANTIFVSVVGTFGALAASLAGAYFFARQRLPFAQFLWAAFMLLLLMPTVVNIVPLFSQLRTMHMLNSLWALILVGIAATQAFNIYVLRGFVEEIPNELFEAAEMDGASHLRQLIHIVLPMSLPILGTLAITTFLGLWNDFLLPLVISREHETFTVGVGLIYLDGEYVRNWGRVMAAFSLASLPILLAFLFTMRLFVRGLAAGAIKG